MDTELIMDNQIAQTMKNSDSLPRAPEELMQKTIIRMDVLSKGVAAERQLGELSGPASEGRTDPEKLTELAAQSLLGRIAAHRELPPGFQKNEAQMLSQDPKFKDLIGQKGPEEILKEVQNGSLVKAAAKVNKKIPEVDKPKEMEMQKTNIKQHRPMSM